MTTPLADQMIAALAAVQYGVVARWQLIAQGVSARQLERRVAKGLLHLVHPGVYALGQPRLAPRGWWIAAVLACGPHAVLSHLHAAALWGLLRARPGPVHVTIPGSSRRRLRGITSHRTRSLPAADRSVVDGIRVTSLSRTLLDLAELVDAETLARALEEADKQNELELRSVEQLLARSPGRPGVRPLRAALAMYRAEPEDLRSELERRFRDLCRAFDLPAASTNVWVEGLLVDAFWPSARLVVEIDSFKHHGSRAAFERDRARDVELRLAGYTVLRFTYRQLVDDPASIARAVARLLAAPAIAPHAHL